MEELLVIGACLLLNALFAAYEMAFVSVPKPELRKLARAGNKDAQRLVNLRESPERTLSIIQVGITLVAATSAAVSGAGATESIAAFFCKPSVPTAPTADRLGIFEPIRTPQALHRSHCAWHGAEHA